MYTTHLGKNTIILKPESYISGFTPTSVQGGPTPFLNESRKGLRALNSQ